MPPLRFRRGEFRQWVTLTDPVPDGTATTFQPSRVKVSMETTGSQEAGIGWRLALRYHPQVTFNTRIQMDDGQLLNVIGIDNHRNADRSGYMVLQCEEVTTP